MQISKSLKEKVSVLFSITQTYTQKFIWGWGGEMGRGEADPEA